MLDLVGKSICCILCRGSILYFDETGITKFGRHMQFEHGAMHDLDFMMAACKMNESEKKALVEVFNKKVESTEEIVKDNSTTIAPPPSTPKKSERENNKPAVKRTPKKKVESTEEMVKHSSTTIAPPPSTPKKSERENDKPAGKRTPKKKETVSSPENPSKSFDKPNSVENGNVLKTKKEI
eukprot:TRINITY_DN9992_c0_g1_i1.p1 TRINITY_DN9992_c0_g1~~TRINITY_DN9992_c0_g1_i1.p1  ORF type:complete len:181 (-),score=60.34 TRINITY_DN9992_c0_g1_i1:909-1451(-)